MSSETSQTTLDEQNKLHEYRPSADEQALIDFMNDTVNLEVSRLKKQGATLTVLRPLNFMINKTADNKFVNRIELKTKSLKEIRHLLVSDPTALPAKLARPGWKYVNVILLFDDVGTSGNIIPYVFPSGKKWKKNTLTTWDFVPALNAGGNGEPVRVKIAAYNEI